MLTNRERINQKFKEEYEWLNDQQKLAVDSIEGPVMVIAGPGTGKTQILSARIGKILLETDTLPQNILCLTYTEAGVLAMRKRLTSFIGPDAYKVNIYTFHAFCHDIIQENLTLFEKTALDPISDLERIRLLKELIDSFPKNHVLKRYRGDVYYEIRSLQSLFSMMKREGWTPAHISQKIGEYLLDLPNREDFIYKKKYREYNAGDLKHDRIEEQKEKMEKLLAAVNEFEKFQQLMRSRNRYDFDDMINWVIKAFEENEMLVRRYQEQFLYILVDEFQDTSGTQNRIVELLINYWDKPNVFVVGDDDQSIYRFQGANLENMLSFSNIYGNDLLTVVLTHNYRSTQPILDISKSLISRNEDRLINKMKGLSKELVSSNPARSLSQPPLIKEYETPEQEMVGITLHVRQLIKQGIPAGHICVIYKENKYGEELTKYFNLQNIPVYSKRSVNVLEIPLARKIILLLKWLTAEHDIPYGGDEMLFEILHFDWFHIPPMEIAKLVVEVAGRRFGDNETSLRRMLFEKSNEPPRDLFSRGIHEGLKAASVVLEKLIADVPNTTLQNLFENCIREPGVLTSIMQSPDKVWQMQVLTNLFDFVKDETRRNPYLGLSELVNTLELMDKEELSLPLIKISGSETGVNLLTAHGSKGMEFEYVFFAGCNASLWEKKRNPGMPYTFPDTLFDSQPKFKEQEEMRRLFYVVLTRAEIHLLISYSRFRPDGKESEPSMFIAEIQEHNSLPVEKVFLDPTVLTDFRSLQFSGEAPEIEQMEEEFVGRLLEKFVMNVTALNNYLKCPLEFYFRNLLRIPSPKNEATEFGSAVHYALEQLFRKMQDTGVDFPSKEIFISDFDWYIHRHRESFTREQFERRLEYGHKVLSDYYNRYVHSWNKIVSIERTIRNVVVDSVPLKGKLDKLEFNGKTVNVVDYKTGDPEKAGPKLCPPNEKAPLGGDYWRQAVFYKLLVDDSRQHDWKVISTEFDFIEPDKKKNYHKEKLVILPQDLTTVKQQISSVWQKIQNREFYSGCGLEDCHWCNFVKTNNMAIALHEEEEV